MKRQEYARLQLWLRHISMKYVVRVLLYNKKGYKLEQSSTAEKQSSGFLSVFEVCLHLFGCPPTTNKKTSWKPRR